MGRGVTVTYRGVAVDRATMELVQLMGMRKRPDRKVIERGILSVKDFPNFYTQISALYGGYPEEVDAISKIILGIRDPKFRRTNLVETNFTGAIRNSGNPQGKISRDEVYSQEKRMGKAFEEFMRLTKEKLIAWPSTPFEDSTNIEKFEPTDGSDVITHGKELFKKFKGNLMALGVGGSSNGSKVITSAFNLKKAKHAGYTFASDYLKSIFGEFNFKNGHIIVTSLSGTTPETLSNLLMAMNALKRAGVEESEFKDHLTVLTGGKESVLREIAKKYNLKVFYCKPSEGGRFSIWTVIGTLWAEANGIDSLQAKAGAMLSQYRIMERKIKKNPAMMQAAIANAAKNKGITLYQNLVFDERLTAYRDFLGQAWGESVEEEGLGLRVRVDVGANWQHISANGLLAVPEGVMAQMFWVQHSDNPVKLNIPQRLRDLPLGKGTIGDLDGKSLDEYQAAAVKGGWASFVGRGIPTSLTIINRISPFTLGQMTQDTFGVVAFYGGVNGLGMKTYEQDWVILHKALGRGETEKIINMPDGDKCARAMHYFEKKFGDQFA